MGYRDALTSNNFTFYLANTQFGVIGDLRKCTDITNLKDAQSSFPSGHASATFCGLGFTALYIMYLLNKYTRKNNMAKTIVGFGFFLSAAVVAATRPRDNWHNYDDVLTGSVIGFACAVFAFFINFGPKHSDQNEDLSRHTFVTPLI